MFNQDIEYLKNAGLNKILSKGLAETYSNKPNYPIDFLANYLLKHIEIEKLKETKKTEVQEIARKYEQVLLEEYTHKLEVNSNKQKEQALKQEKLSIITTLEKVN